MLLVMSFIVTATSSCCRWTSGGACSSAESDQCTELHEYLERKTSTHIFEDIDGSLGSDQTQWAWKFDVRMCVAMDEGVSERHTARSEIFESGLGVSSRGYTT